MPRLDNKVAVAPKSDGPLSAVQSASYMLPVIPIALLFSPMPIIQGIYARHYGLALTTLAAIILISRILDAVSDPIIGYMSDRCREKYGTRKPFMIAGSLLSVVCGYFLYMPPDTVSTLYAGFWIVALYTAFTLFEIPHITWPADIARDARDKTKLYSYRVFSGYCGQIVFYCIPLLPFFETNAITPESLKFTFMIAAALTLPLLFQAMRTVPNGLCFAKERKEKTALSRQALRSGLTEIMTNRPFLLFVVAFFCSGFAIGMWYGLIYIYVDAYLNMGDQFAKMFLISFMVGLAVTPLWYRIAIKIGKKSTWMLAMMLMLTSFVFTGVLEPGTTTFTQLLLLKVAQTCGYVCFMAITPATLSEIVDYSEWKTGHEKRAIYFSIKVMLEKTSVAIGGALGLALAGWLGFDVTSNEHLQESINGLKVVIAWVPALIIFLSVILIALNPINERRHDMIRRRLDARLVRAEKRESIIVPVSN